MESETQSISIGVFLLQPTSSRRDQRKASVTSHSLDHMLFSCDWPKKEHALKWQRRAKMMCRAELSDDSSDREPEAEEYRDSGRKVRRVERDEKTEENKSRQDEESEKREQESQSKEDKASDAATKDSVSSHTPSSGPKYSAKGTASMEESSGERTSVVANNDSLGKDDDENVPFSKNENEETQSRDSKKDSHSVFTSNDREEWLLGRLEDKSIPYITVNSSIGKYFIEDEKASSSPQRAPIAEERSNEMDLRSDADQSPKTAYKTGPSEYVSMGGQAQSTPRPSSPKEKKEEEKPADKSSKSISETVDMLRESGLPEAKLRENEPPAPSFLVSGGSKEEVSKSTSRNTSASKLDTNSAYDTGVGRNMSGNASKVVSGTAPLNTDSSPRSVMASQAENQSRRTVSIGPSERVNTSRTGSSTKLSQGAMSTGRSNTGNAEPEEFRESIESAKAAQNTPNEKEGSLKTSDATGSDKAEKTEEKSTLSSPAKSGSTASMRSGTSKASGTNAASESDRANKPENSVGSSKEVISPSEQQENVFESTQGSAIGNSTGGVKSDSKDEAKSTQSTVSGGTEDGSKGAFKDSTKSVGTLKTTRAPSDAGESAQLSVKSRGSNIEEILTDNAREILPSAQPTPPPSLKPFVAPPIPFPGPTGLSSSPEKSREFPTTETQPEISESHIDKTAEIEENILQSLRNANELDEMEQETLDSAEEAKHVGSEDSSGKIEVLGSGVPSIKNASTLSTQTAPCIPSPAPENEMKEGSVGSAPVGSVRSAAVPSDDHRSSSIGSISSKKSSSELPLDLESEAKKPKRADASENAEWHSTPTPGNNVGSVASSQNGATGDGEDTMNSISSRNGKMEAGASAKEPGSMTEAGDKTISDVFSKVSEIKSVPEVPFDQKELRNSSEEGQSISKQSEKRDLRGSSAAGSVAPSSISRRTADSHVDAAASMVSSPETLKSTEASPDTMLESAQEISQREFMDAGVSGSLGQGLGYNGIASGPSSVSNSVSQNTNGSQRSYGSRNWEKSAKMDSSAIGNNEVIGVGGVAGIGAMEAMLGGQVASAEPRAKGSVKSSSSVRSNGKEQGSESVPISEQLRMMGAGPSTCQCVRNTIRDRNGSNGTEQGSMVGGPGIGYVSEEGFGARKLGCGCSVCRSEETGFSLLEGIDSIAIAPGPSPSETPRKEIRLSVDHGSKEELCVIRIMLPGECKERIEKLPTSPSEFTSSPSRSSVASSSYSGLMSDSGSQISAPLITFTEPEEVAGDVGASETGQSAEGSGTKEDAKVEVEHPEKASVKKLIDYYESLSKDKK